MVAREYDVSRSGRGMREVLCLMVAVLYGNM